MFKHPIIICISILLFLIPTIVGCKGKPKAAVQKSKIVSQKINSEPESSSEKETGDSTMPDSTNNVDQNEKNKEVGSIKNDENIENNQFNEDMEGGQKSELTISQIKSEDNIESKAQITKKIELIENKSEEKEKRKAAELLASIHQQANLLNKDNNDLDTLINPFLPLFSDAPAAPKDKKKKKVRDPKELTPLEKVDLSQLKLVATLRAVSGNKALVEDSTGKGYVVNKGTYIGINSGSIVEITNESIVVEEEIETLAGDIKIEKREIKLQKAPGE